MKIIFKPLGKLVNFSSLKATLRIEFEEESSGSFLIILKRTRTNQYLTIMFYRLRKTRPSISGEKAPSDQC